GRCECEEAGERRAVDVDDAALDGRLLADVFIRLLPRDRLVGGDDDARNEEGDEGQQRSHASLTRSETAFYKPRGSSSPSPLPSCPTHPARRSSRPPSRV